jgi:hypothetical protein
MCDAPLEIVERSMKVPVCELCGFVGFFHTKVRCLERRLAEAEKRNEAPSIMETLFDSVVRSIDNVEAKG